MKGIKTNAALHIAVSRRVVMLFVLERMRQFLDARNHSNVF